VKPERLEKLIVSAAKQSRHLVFPKLHPMIPFAKFVGQQNSSAKFIAHCMAGVKTPFRSIVSEVNDLLILIGPEGDFSPQELDLAIGAAYKSVSLGESRLRTETAALVACTLFSV
jgi:16S rRNA (uracil1498-N3)-methyltransferase